MTDLERMVLQFAALSWKHKSARDAEILRQFGWSSVRYTQCLVSLARRADAQAFAPATCRAVVDRIGGRHRDHWRRGPFIPAP